MTDLNSDHAPTSRFGMRCPRCTFCGRLTARVFHREKKLACESCWNHMANGEVLVPLAQQKKKS